MDKAIEVSLQLKTNMYDRMTWRTCIDNNGMAPVYPQSEETVKSISKLKEMECDDEEIDWGMFDKIYCFHYVHDVKRYEPLRSELMRVGIWGRNNFELVETVRTQYEERHLSGYSKGELNLAINTLRCLERAKAHGYKRILFLEDDIRFLKEKKWIRMILNNSPNTDIVLYDKMNFIFPEDFNRLCSENKINDFYAKWESGLYATSCYSLNESAITKLIDGYNEKLRPIDHYLQDGGLSKAFSYVNICCQEADEESMLYERVTMNVYNQKNGYAFQGLDFSLYQTEARYGELPVDDKPILPIVVVGKNRTRMTVEVFKRIHEHIKGVKPRYIYVSDHSFDGNARYIQRKLGNENIHVDVIETNSNEWGYGSVLNIGLKTAYKLADVCFILDNDWILRKDIDFTQYVHVVRNSHIGVISFKHIPANVTTKEYQYQGKTYLIKGRQGGGVSYDVELGCMLISQRLSAEVGSFLENSNADAVELDFLQRYSRIGGEVKQKKRILSANDKDLYHKALNEENCLFYHVGKHGSNGIQWDIPNEFDYLNDEQLDRQICKQNIQNKDFFIRWDSLFDKIYVLHHLEQRTKLFDCKNEMKRIGIEDSGICEYRYTSKSRYDKDIFAKVRSDTCGYVSSINIALEMQRIFKEAYWNGYERILIIQDDAKFLEDEGLVNRILNNIPRDYEYVQLDKFIPNEETRNRFQREIENNSINDFFVNAENRTYTSATALSITRAGMRKLIDAYDKGMSAIDMVYLNANVKRAVAKVNVCVQKKSIESIYYTEGQDREMDSLYGNSIKKEDYGIGGLKTINDTMIKGKKKIAICWIGVGDYNVLFEEMYRSFKVNFCTELERIFFIFTDEEKKYEGIKDCRVYPIRESSKDASFIKFRKFKHLSMAESDFLNVDYVLFVNGNTTCLRKVAFEELSLYGDMIGTVSHPLEFNIGKGTIFRNVCSTSSFIPDRDMTYRQAGIWICSSKRVLHMINRIESWRQEDKLFVGNNVLYWHDEAYYNRYIYENEKSSYLLDWRIWNVDGDEYKNLSDQEKREIAFLLRDKKNIPKVKEWQYNIEHNDIYTLVDTLHGTRTEYEAICYADGKKYTSGGWEMDEYSLGIIEKIYKKLECKKVLDIGSGKTSLIMEALCANVDHIENERGRLNEFLMTHPYLEREKFKITGLRQGEYGNYEYENLSDIVNNKKYDLIIVDGPYDTSRSSYVRTDIFHNIQLLGDKYCIAIHDLNRERDMKSAKLLAEKLGQKLYVFNQSERWLGIISNRDDIENICNEVK